MPCRHRFRPAVDCLEDRWVPASIRLAAGNLIITDQVGPLQVNVSTTPGRVTVSDDAGSTTVSGVSSLIYITGTNAPDSIRYSGNTGFKGNVIINSLNGADSISLSGPIGGNLIVLTGLGNDSLTFTGTTKIGGLFTYADGFGFNRISQNGALVVGKDMTVFGVATYTQGTALRVGGFATFTATQTTANVLTLSLPQELSVGKALTVTGGALGDNVSLLGKVSVGGTASFNLRGGNNKLVLDPDAGGTGFNGNLFAQFNGGNDRVVFGANLIVAGNARLDLGNGSNNFADNAATQYSGDLVLVGGNDSNTTVVRGIVDGNLNLSVGNGDNLTTVTGFLAGRLLYRGGNGTEALNLLPTAEASLLVDVQFGTGDATLELNANVTLNGLVQGSAGTYTLIQNDATLLPTLILIDFP